MRKRSLALLALSLAAVPAGVAAQATPTSTAPGAVREAIEAANARHSAAVKRGDTTAIMANYAADAVLMIPNQAALRGAAAKRASMQQMAEYRRAGIPFPEETLRTDDVLVGPDFAVESGTYVWVTRPKNAAAATERGKYLTVWTRQPDGTWKIARDIYNTDQPAKP